MIEGKSKAETIVLTAEFLGISLLQAAFIWAIEHDEIQGDVIIVQEGDIDNET